MLRKACLIGGMVLLVALTGIAQDGAITFANLGSGAGGTSVNSPVFDVDGQTRLAGSGFSVQLYFGTSGTADHDLTPLGSPVLDFNTGPFAGFFGSPVVQIPSFGIGSQPRLQVRAWDNQSGSITTWHLASVRGESFSFISPPLGDSLNPSSIPVMQGLQSFALVPEPSIVMLGVLGAGGFFFLRRRR